MVRVPFEFIEGIGALRRSSPATGVKRGGFLGVDGDERISVVALVHAAIAAHARGLVATTVRRTMPARRRTVVWQA
jgi:hypothetical protein